MHVKIRVCRWMPEHAEVDVARLSLIVMLEGIRSGALKVAPDEAAQTLRSHLEKLMVRPGRRSGAERRRAAYRTVAHWFARERLCQPPGPVADYLDEVEALFIWGTMPGSGVEKAGQSNVDGSASATEVQRPTA
jgi:hypothetical protein